MPKAGSAAAMAVAMSPEEREEAETRVLVPEVDTVRVKIGEHEVDLRPLTIKFAKQIAAIANPIFSKLANLKEANFDYGIMTELQDGLTKALCVLGQFYRIPLNAEYIEENLTSTEVRMLLDQQLELTRNNDHLAASLRHLLTAAQRNVEVTQLIARQTTALPLEKELPLSPSVKPGESASTSSSPATPEGS